MAVSESYDFSMNRNDVITEALQLIGEYSPGESLQQHDVSACNNSLNLMIKSWQSKDYGLWLNQEVILFLQADDVDYSLGPTGDHCALTSNAAKTELSAAAASGATTFTIDSITGMTDNFDRDGILTATTPAAGGSLTLDGALVSGSIATLSSQRKILIYSDGDDSGVTFAVTGTNNIGTAVTETITGPNTTTVYSTNTYNTVSSIVISGAGTGSIEIGQVGDNIGIELDSGSMQWTYIGAALSTTITPIDALSGAAAVDNHVYVYTSKIQRPLDIIEARLVDSDDNETPLAVVGRNDYMGLSDKDTESTINQIYYDKQLTNGVLYTWPETDSVKDRIKMTIKRPVQDLDANTDDFDFPIEWLEPIIYNLAKRIGPKFGTKVSQDIKDMAVDTLNDVQGFDKEDASFIFKPDIA